MSAFSVSRPLTLILAVLTVLALGGAMVAPAAAQTVPDQPPGIVATGYGRASGPAASASVQIIVGREMYGYAEMTVPPEETVPAEGAASASPTASEVPSGMSMGPGVPPLLTEADIAPVVDAVVAAGVPGDQITVLLPAYSSMYSGPGGFDSAQIRFSISNPVVDDLTKIARAAQEAAQGAGLSVQHIGVLYKGSDCTALEQQARTAAVADGRMRAEGLAKALNANLGELIQAADNFFGYGPYVPASLSECVSQSSVDYGAGPGMDPPFDPTQPAEIVIYAAVTLTFAMTPGAAATPSAYGSVRARGGFCRAPGTAHNLVPSHSRHRRPPYRHRRCLEDALSRGPTGRRDRRRRQPRELGSDVGPAHRSRRASNPALLADVRGRLEEDWSPEQVAAWLRREHPTDPTRRVSRVTIDRTIYVAGRRALGARAARRLARPLRSCPLAR